MNNFFSKSELCNLSGGKFDLQCRFYQSSTGGFTDKVYFKKPDTPSNTWVIVLHGHGSLGDQLFVRPDIRDTWLPLLIESGLGIISPDLRANAWMGPNAAQDLSDILHAVEQEFPSSRFALLGGSMGGTGALIYAGLHPQDIDFVAAYCPATDLTLLIEYLSACEMKDSDIIGEIRQAIEKNYGQITKSELYPKHSTLNLCQRLTMPLAIIHGDKDIMIPVEHSRLLRDNINSPRLFYKEIAGGGHDAPLTHTEPIEMMIEHLKHTSNTKE